MYSTAIKGFDPLTEEEYLSSLVYEAFTPMSLGMLAEFMTEHDDLCIVTDIKDRNVDAAALIAEEYPELQDRFIIQIYSGSEYDPICELGYENIIFTLYALDWNSKTDADALVEYAKSHKLFAYTIPASLVENEEYLSKMKGAGVPLLVHTVNGPETRRHYLDMGISAVYTDYGLGYDDPPEGIH